MKNLSILFIVFLSLHLNTLAQAPDTLWTKTFDFGGPYTGGCFGSSVQQTSDGGYIVAGYVLGGEGWLVKTDAFGDTLWTKKFGVMSNCNFVQQTIDSAYIVVGAELLPWPALWQVWLSKIDASGNTIWTKTYGGNLSDMGLSVQQTTDGGYIITGYTDISSGDGEDVLLLKTDAYGDSLWARIFGNDDKNDAGVSVRQTTDGGYIIAASTESFGAGSMDIWLIKTDSTGDTLWTETFGGASYDYAKSVQQTTDEGYILLGETASFGAGREDIWLIKTDSSGDIIWTKIFGGSTYDCAGSCQQTNDGGYIITGGTVSFSTFGRRDLWLIKTNASGDTLWTKTIGTNLGDHGHSVQQTLGGGYIITGWTGHGSLGYLVKTTPDVSYINQDNDLIPLDYFLYQNYPNPFNPATKIRYTIPQTSNVIFKVFDILGNEIETLVNEEKQTGTCEVTWYAEGMPSGVYFYQLRAGDFVETKKMVLIK